MRRRGEEKQQQALGEGERFSSRWLEKEEAAAGAWRREKQQGVQKKLHQRRIMQFGDGEGVRVQGRNNGGEE